MIARLRLNEAVAMLQKTKDAPCFLCETVPAHWNDPAIAEHPEQAGRELAALERRVADLESGLTTPDELHHHLLQMCAMCQEVMMDEASKDEMLDRLRYRVDRLRRERDLIGEAR